MALPELPHPVHEPLAAWLAAHDEVAPGVVEGLYVVGSIALADWTPHSDIDIVAVVADPSDPDLVSDFRAAQSLLRERLGVSIDGPYVAWGDLVVPAMAVPTAVGARRAVSRGRRVVRDQPGHLVHACHVRHRDPG